MAQRSIASFFKGGAAKPVPPAKPTEHEAPKSTHPLSPVESPVEDTKISPHVPVRKRKVIRDEESEEKPPSPRDELDNEDPEADGADAEAPPPPAVAAPVPGVPTVSNFFAPRKRAAPEAPKADDSQKPGTALNAPKKKHKEATVLEAPEALSVSAVNSAAASTAAISAAVASDASAAGPSGAMWVAGAPVPYLALARVFESIEAISSRLKIGELLRDFFRQVLWLTPNDLLPTIYLSINRLAPEYQGIELGVGESILMRAVADATGRTQQMVKASYTELGDLGLVAKASRNVQRTMMPPTPLTVQSVFKTLREIALEKGHASQGKKQGKIKQLIVSCREAEATYLIRSLEGKLRIGLAEQSVLVAIAHAVIYTPPGASPRVWNAAKGVTTESFAERLTKATETLKSVFSELPNYDMVIPALLKHGIEELPRHCFLTPGIPVKPMLAQPTKGITEVLDRFTGVPFTCEYKYDGERAQIHRLADGSILVYSRNLENNTAKYPDIIQNLPHAINHGTTSFILDCEAVAYDRVAKKILPFQVLSTRARKGVELEDIKVQVQLYAFDLLYLNGQSHVKAPFAERRELLHKAFHEVEGEFAFASHKDASDTEEIQAFLNEAIANSCEGLMIKTLESGSVGSSYEPSKRSYKWLKVKKDYLQGLADSFDLVPVGAFYGRGKRTGVYGAYLLACYDDENEVYQTCCKIGTGFSDEALQTHTQFLKEHVIEAAKPYYRFGDTAQPDVWFEPAQVWEVQAADLSISPAYKAAEGMVAPSKGISLRFPRFIRIRDDKKPEDATTSSQVATMFRRQVNAGDGNKGGGNDDDDY